MAQFSEESDESGSFERQEDAFRDWVGGERHPVEAGRYHLYVSLACPWAHRALIARDLMGLAEVVSSSMVDPVRDERGWAFRDGRGHGPDPVEGFGFLSEAYEASDPEYRGRYTVPVLWDRVNRRIVNNSEDDICRMFAGEFQSLVEPTAVEWFPGALKKEQEVLSREIYERVNNGVYRAGFATAQDVYEEAFRGLFEALDVLELRLEGRDYLLGSSPVESDWRLFCTMIRFDAVYYGHFKCNWKRIVDYPNLQRHTEALFVQPGVAETVDFDHIKRHYYVTHDDINPNGIVPVGPELRFTQLRGPC